MTSRILHTIIFIFIVESFLMAQNAPSEITQIVRGTVKDALTGKALTESTIKIVSLDQKTVSNTEGVFNLEKIPVGRYDIEFSYIGYTTFLLKNILVESGKETVLDVSLNLADTDLATVTITSTNLRAETSLVPALQILEKDRFQYAATFADPARYATYAPGVSVENDQANNISIRGITPNALQWYLEGAEIVNPNHLSNAGSLTDRASANGGGVMIMSAQLLEGTTFYQGAAPPSVCKCFGGCFRYEF
ncbi:MAG: carboxypeptidase-like regulatory domain-containing protein [Saprospiraceae bacterium]|nr:carboxypeptidase-like regulatory domain-containing protein [Saprospiraceae bacterium]